MPLPDGMTESAQRMFAVVALMALWWVGEGTSLAVTAIVTSGIVSTARHHA